MRATVLSIGMLDVRDTAHMVPLQPGVNVITGRSSKGKSALIEIFDYCFGSSDYTVPAGVITTNASLFFVVFRLQDSLLVLGRLPNKGKAFLQEELDLSLSERIDWIRLSYFDPQLFMPLPSYLEQLKNYFGIDVTDVDEDPEARQRRQKKLPTPSVRSFTSFILQHQNLIANKHAIFYRFDEKEKREQAIDHFKVFLGFAKQDYFMLKQKEYDLEMRYRQLSRALPRKQERMEWHKERLQLAHQLYEAVSGKKLDFDAALAVKRPATTLKQLRQTRIRFSADSDVHVQQLQNAQAKKGKITAHLREKQIELSEIESARSFNEKYESSRRTTLLPQRAHLQQGECPFCHTGNLSVEPEANQLGAAIDWLNSELSRSSYRQASFDEEEARLKADLRKIRGELTSLETHMAELRSQISEYAQVRNQYETTVAAHARLEAALEEWANEKGEGSDAELKQLEADLQDIRRELRDRYDMTAKMAKARERITELMEMYGQRFDFEAGYKPIHLRLSLDTFDLWHEIDERHRVFLRAMGSGANWLARHLVLFLSLQRYFCELGDQCSIPPILFLDQPSQVYFPAVLDGNEEFDAHELARNDATRSQDAERSQAADQRSVDEDLEAVANLFDQLVQHCNETEEATKIRPQIIVTDHADHLKLKSGAEFELLVRSRWRAKGAGFINQSGQDAGVSL